MLLCSTRGIIVVDGGFVAEVLYRYKWPGRIVMRIYKSEEYVLGQAAVMVLQYFATDGICVLRVERGALHMPKFWAANNQHSPD